MQTNGETVLFFLGVCVCRKLCAYEADVINILFLDVRIVELSQALNHKDGFPLTCAVI